MTSSYGKKEYTRENLIVLLEQIKSCVEKNEILEDDRDKIPPNDDMLIMWENFKGIMRNRPSAESKHTDNIVFEAETQGVKYGESIESYNLGLCRYLKPDDFCDYESDVIVIDGTVYDILSVSEID